MNQFVKNFYQNEDGAVTVDWVVLTALLVALAGAAYAGVEGGVSDLTTAIRSFLQAIIVGG